MKTYKQLSYKQRCQIYVLKKKGESQQLIGDTVDVNQSTISKELERSSGQRGYRHKQAQSFREKHRLTAVKPL